jgi:hypothetical protein
MSRFQRPNFRGRCDTVHDRHLQIHQHHIEAEADSWANPGGLLELEAWTNL